jgi:hypothetical protein
MATSKRIYAVKDKTNSIDYLVKATTPAQAVRHIAKGQFDVQPASALEAVEAINKGVVVHDAEEQQPTTTE